MPPGVLSGKSKIVLERDSIQANRDARRRSFGSGGVQARGREFDVRRLPGEWWRCLVDAPALVALTFQDKRIELLHFIPSPQGAAVNSLRQAG